MVISNYDLEDFEFKMYMYEKTVCQDKNSKSSPKFVILYQFPFAQEANFFPQISIIGTFGEEKESLKR